MIDQAVIAWRAANGGAALPVSVNQKSKEWKALLDQMFLISQNSRHIHEEAAALATKHDYTPLRLVLSGAAKYALYAAAKDKEWDNRLEPFAWVYRLALEHGIKGFVLKAKRWVSLPPVAAAETTLHEWPEAKDWAERKSSFASFEEKTAFLAEASRGVKQLCTLVPPLKIGQYAQLFEAWQMARERANRKSTRVINPGFAMPFGAVRFKNSGKVFYLCVGTEQAHALLYRWAPSEQERETLRKAFKALYQSQSAAEERFSIAIARNARFSLLRVDSGLAKHSVDGFFNEKLEASGHNLDFEPEPDPRLNVWYEKWLKKHHKEVEVWIAPEVLDATGQLMLDKLLGIELAQDYEPLTILSVERRANRSGGPLKFLHWFDVFRDDLEKPQCDLGEAAYSIRSYKASSRCAALEQIRTLSIVMGEQDLRLINAREVAQAPQPPEGVERWLMVTPEDMQG